jgi:putative hydrolase of the HAD superfamily
VLFDVYGTLFISGSGDVAVLENSVQEEKLGALLKRHGVHRPPQQVRRRYFDRIREVHELHRRQGVDYPEVVIERIWDDVLEFESREQSLAFSLEYEMLFNPVWPMPGLEGMLFELKRLGLSLGIVSNAQFFTPLLFRALLKKDPDDLGIDGELALYSYLYGYAKPSAFLFERARAITMRCSIWGTICSTMCTPLPYRDFRRRSLQGIEDH